MNLRMFQRSVSVLLLSLAVLAAAPDLDCTLQYARTTRAAWLGGLSQTDRHFLPHDPRSAAKRD